MKYQAQATEGTAALKAVYSTSVELIKALSTLVQFVISFAQVVIADVKAYYATEPVQLKVIEATELVKPASNKVQEFSSNLGVNVLSLYNNATEYVQKTTKKVTNSEEAKVDSIREELQKML